MPDNDASIEENEVNLLVACRGFCKEGMIDLVYDKGLYNIEKNQLEQVKTNR